MRVAFFFDFISPYSYLASQLLAKRQELAALDIEAKPVIFGSILSKLGVKGPGEIPSRRRLGLADAMMLASHYDLPFEGPPSHPFNSIYALRSVCAVADAKRRLALAQRFFEAAWAEGESLEDLSVLRRCIAECGLEVDPEAAASAAENRQALKANTEALLALGGWGVPTFVAGDALFFGHDRLELLRAFIGGRATLDREKLERMLERPQPGRLR
jgi:2-hydroxychromene-2-carboxylate isomerase